MSETTAASLTAAEIAALLDEPNVFLITRAIRVIGGTRVEALVEQTLHIEATGGRLTEDQRRRRTPGGTLFALMRETVSRGERYRLFGVPGTPQGTPAQPCTWEDVQQAITELVDAQEATMKLTVIGRPGVVQTTGQAVLFQLKGKPPASLPRGLPDLPKVPPITWTVMVALRQWNKVKESLATDPTDKLVIDGYPLLHDDQHILMANNCVSVAMQRAQKEAQRSSQGA